MRFMVSCWFFNDEKRDAFGAEGCKAQAPIRIGPGRNTVEFMKTENTAMVSALVLVCAAFFSPTALADEQAERQAVAAAEQWLALVDDGAYMKSWETTAQYFRDAVTAAQWRQALTGARKPLGKVVARTVKSKQYATSLPGAPDGQYVVVQFETSFANKKSAVETVTPMIDADGTWRVAGYFVK